MPVIDATVAGASSNSYQTLMEANEYHDGRIPLPTPWVASGDASIRALITATRVMDSMASPFRTFVRGQSGDASYHIVRRQWTGAPSTTTQRLAWPRTGMYNRNGVAIPSGEIPFELKEAHAELAGQLLNADTTLDNAVAVGGITSVRAGSVSVSFKDLIEQHVLPDAVMNLLPPSWFTDEEVVYTTDAIFEVL
jgi:hypothetical protein